MKQPNILVTGATGQIGRELAAMTVHYPSLQVHSYDRSTLDLTDHRQIERVLSEKTWHYCLNCAAYTAVDRAESEAELARAINREGAHKLAEACRQNQTRLIHFSTDYVYHNQLNRPLQESDPVNPQSVYAQTKLEGEQAIREALPEALILRTSWVYSSFGHNFVKTMRRLGPEREGLNIVFDQVGTPTYARDIARACLEIIRQTESGQLPWQGGLYNYSNEGVCSWYDFALAVFELSGIACSVTPIESKDYPTAAKRPTYSVLNKARFKSAFQTTIPHWREALVRCLRELD